MEISNEIMRDCSRKLLLTRARLLQNNGFYGILLMHMKFALSEDIDSATADDKKMYFNPEFVMSLSDKETEYVIMHLISHVVLRHNSRNAGLKENVFYDACDIVVNSNILHSSNMDEKSIYLKSYGGVQPHLAPDGSEGYEHTAEEIYEMLLASNNYNNNPLASDSNSKSIVSGEGRGNDTSESDNANGSGWDDHFSKQQSTDDEESDAEWMLRTVEAAEMSENREKVLREERNKSCGTLPLFAERILNDLRNPKTDWRQVLDEFIQEEINDYSFTPPDRRFEDLDFFLPDYSERDDSVEDILFMIDTSGSMSDEDITECYSEIKGAIDQFNGKLTGWLGFFDAKVVEPKRFEDEDEFKIIRPRGGGGTSFHCIFEYVREHIDEINPVSIIILTDGYAPFPKQTYAMGIPVLWIINNNEVIPPWGKVINK